MKNQELLELIGDADEQYVLAADSNVTRPRFRWKALAACAACMALAAIAVYPRVAFGNNSAGGMSANSSADSAPAAAPEGDSGAAVQGTGEADDAAGGVAGTVVRSPGLHEYTLIEEGVRVLTTEGAECPKAATGTDDAALEAPPVPEPNAGAPATGGFEGGSVDAPYDPDSTAATAYDEAAIDQSVATRQYQDLLLNGGIGCGGEGDCPEWFAGAWLDNDWPDNVSRLTVAIVDDFRTPELESQIKAWCGGTGDVLFCTAKYSAASLDGLLDEVCGVFDQYGWLPSVMDANEVTNRVEVDLFAMPSDDVLAALDGLDPEGDAIFVRVFLGHSIRLTDGTAEEEGSPVPECPEYDLLDGADE